MNKIWNKINKNKIKEKYIVAEQTSIYTINLVLIKKY